MKYPAGTPTQPEVIAIALSKLKLKSSDVFADIGCGSGSVSIAASNFVKQVYAMDDREEAVLATRENIKECGINNIEVCKGEAASLLQSIEPNCAFLGGTRNLEKVLEILIKRVPRFVVSAVRLETATLALGMMKEHSRFKELIHIQLSRGNELAGGTFLKPENPVFLIVGDGEC